MCTSTDLNLRALWGVSLVRKPSFPDPQVDLGFPVQKVRICDILGVIRNWNIYSFVQVMDVE
ncbi:hypothetical protein SCLCIDRAFT_1212156 [Scleroderma citrinum Foug A]|uniref:Uncharacterized protein n=1 Tax=Scleroderma citrinum Foug A TaxID=1036808 RepID=A0A0C2ZVA2_9AGAM|nr:hypothetical protein SCLCIDRAFT_1212156 [Scleroderma citrinum Foug A]